MTLIRLRKCAGWSEALLVAHTTLLEISCRGLIIIVSKMSQIYFPLINMICFPSTLLLINHETFYS